MSSYYEFLNSVSKKSIAQDESLAEHDRKYHPNGYKEGDKCALRDAAKKADDIREKKDPEAEKSLDAEYMDAVEKGDMEKAERMVHDAAHIAMRNTKVTDDNGRPLVVYHGGTFGFNGNNIANGLVHFGSIQAAADRITDIGDLGAVKRKDGWHFTDGDGYESDEAYKTRDAAIMSKINDGVKGYFLNIRNPAETEDRLSDPEFDEEMGIHSLIADDRHKGYDGNFYMNNIEDAGSTSWVAYEPNQIKLADPVTYDDDGKVIPLSKRFDMTNPDIRY